MFFKAWEIHQYWPPPHIGSISKAGLGFSDRARSGQFSTATTLPNSPRPTAITLMRLHALTCYLPGPRQYPSLSPSCKKVMRSVPKNLAIKNKDCPLGVTMGNQYTTVQNRNMQSHCKGGEGKVSGSAGRHPNLVEDKPQSYYRKTVSLQGLG